MVARDSEYGFKVARVGSGVIQYPVARFACRCGATHDQRLVSGKPLNPEAIAKDATRAGWKVDAWHPSVTQCPACQAKRAERRAGESPGAKEIKLMTPPAKVEPKEPTKDQKIKIRTLLDTHFDDDVGTYLDGWSDQRIGEEVGIPWAAVTKIREAAWGPIRVDPEIVAIAGQIKALRSDLEALQKQAAGIEQRIGDLHARMEALAKKRVA